MPLRPPISFSCATIWKALEPLAVDAHGNARLETDRHLLALVGGLLRRDGHAEIDQFDAVDVQVFQLARLVADVQAVLVGAVGLGRGGLDGDVPLVAIGDHLGCGRGIAGGTFRSARGRSCGWPDRGPRPPTGSGTGRCPCRSRRGRRRRPRPRGRPAGRPWRSAAGRSTCPADRRLRTSPAIARRERRNRGKVLPGRRRSGPSAAPMLRAFCRIASRSSQGCPRST